MQIPSCRDCGKDDQQRLMDEAEEHWTFGCTRCKTIWVVSKPRTQSRAQAEAAARRITQATERERAYLSRTRYFDTSIRGHK